MHCTFVSTPRPHYHTIYCGNITTPAPVQKTSDKVSGAALAMCFDKVNSHAHKWYIHIFVGSFGSTVASWVVGSTDKHIAVGVYYAEHSGCGAQIR
jgi:hypothetical protein